MKQSMLKNARCKRCFVVPDEKKLSTNFVILGGRSARCVRISFTDDKAR